MKLVTFGDSWVWGDELKSRDAEYRSKVNIGGLINKDYEFESYINYANNGASNERIILQLMEYKNSKYYNENDFLVIGLSSLCRKLIYLNEIKKSFTIPAWDYETHIKNNESTLSNQDGFESYMKSVLRFEVNDRNDLVRYSINLNALKSLLSSHKKYIVFQSIDIPKKLFDYVNSNKKDWEDIHLHHDYNNKEQGEPSSIFFDKKNLIKEISSNLENTQKWINLSEDSWYTYLLENSESHITKLRSHPTEIQTLDWYNKILKKYIDKLGLTKKKKRQLL